MSDKFSRILAFVPDDSLGEFSVTTQTYSYSFTGLPPGTKGMVVDNLFRVFSHKGIQVEAGIIATFVVPENGTVNITNLRDSLYTLYITTPGYTGFTKEVSIGDPDKFI